MGGFAGGIVAGAMGGLGGAMEKQGEIAQQQQGQYANASNLAELNANLDVQKQASLMNLQRQQKLDYIASLKAAADAEDARNNPRSPSAATPSAQQVPQMGLDTSQISPAVLDYLKKQDPDAVTQGIKNMQLISANQPAANPGDSTVKIDGVPVTTTLNPPPNPAVNYPVAATSQSLGGANNAYWKPPARLLYDAAVADQFNPGTGLEMIKGAVPDATGKMLLGQGIKPGSPEWVQGYANAQKKAESMSGRQGGFEWSPDGTLLSSTPNAQGIFYTQDPQTKSLIPHQSPGYTNLLANAAAAEKGGALQGTNQLTIAPEYALPTNADGKKVPVSITGALENGATGQGAGLSPAQTASFAANAKAAEDNQKLPQTLTATKQTISGLEKALQMLDVVNATGAGTENVNKYMSAINNAIPILDDKGNANYQLLGKYLNNALSQASSVTGANASDARFEQFSHGQPNIDTLTKPALREAIQYVLSQQDAAKAGAQFITQKSQELASLGVANPDAAAQKAWGNMYEPGVFEFNRMSPTQRSAFKAQMNQQQQLQFGQKYNQFHANGWVD